MLDFLKIEIRPGQRQKDGYIVYPNFVIKATSDLMIKGGDFYAIWIEARGTWSTNEQDAIRLIDSEIDAYVEEHRSAIPGTFKVLHMWDSSSGVIDRWHKYCQKQMRDNYMPLDEELIFANTETTKESYASKRLPYSLEAGDYSAWDKLVGVLYSPDERHKIEWCIGAIVTGASRSIQKFAVLYGSAGTGKSTILNIIQKLFDGYCSTFDSKALGASSSQFALEAFRDNPLVAIQHDGDLSHIEDNTRINSIVSHEYMRVNEKFKATYTSKFSCFLFMGTNKPVRITDAKSGLIRRLIDISPTGDKVSALEYRKLVKKIDFELGAIAYHCMEVYNADPNAYDTYIPTSMMSATNDMYNFIEQYYPMFQKEGGVSLKMAWDLYNQFVTDDRVPYPMSRRSFKEELANYFHECVDRYTCPDGTRVRNYYKDFRIEKIESQHHDIPEIVENVTDMLPEWLHLTDQPSLFDDQFADCPAQYATKQGIPKTNWASVTTQLSDLNTSKVHYVRVPLYLIVIDFDLRGDGSEKSLEQNLYAAKSWPATYAEVSKSGKGLHLHYIYNGDPNKLSRLFDENIEIKVFTGFSTLRRAKTLCNNVPIATISSGLPMKEDSTVVNKGVIKSEIGIRRLVKKALKKEINQCGSTKTAIDFIDMILKQAYESGLHYDISNMYNNVLSFAMNSTHNSDYCVRKVSGMHFKSDEPAIWEDNANHQLVFYDTEVFPNLFVVVWKRAKEDVYTKLINPSPTEVSNFINDATDKIDFNGREYDRHILWARMLGYSNEELYRLSKRLIDNEPGGKFYEAINIGYTDIYDFASAGNKKSLKKLEIEMGIHHQELGLDWDKPVPKELWPKVAEYCCNDVMATEQAFYYLKADWLARQILADLSGGSVNDTTNQLTSKLIFGKERHPKNEFVWRDMSKPVMSLPPDIHEFLNKACPEMMAVRHGPAQSLLPYFPDYRFKNGVSTYKGITVGEGGRVSAVPGMYFNVALLDIASMHPHSAIAEVIFGVRFTTRFREIVEGRVSIKHEAWDEVNQMLGGMLSKFIDKVKSGEITSGDLANALKTAINSVYGETSAKFDNIFRNPANIDNIVAKRGALFMIDLEEVVSSMGFTVAHIKTDSIKIPEATPEIIKFVIDFGKKYGYTFEHEATYERMCLVNKAVYIAKFATEEYCMNAYGYSPKDNHKHGGEWTATGAEFQIPYVFKTLFSKEEVLFEDLCVTFSVKTALHLDMNEAFGWDEETSKKCASESKKLETKIGKIKARWQGKDPLIKGPDSSIYRKYTDDMDSLAEAEELYKKCSTYDDVPKKHDYIFIGKVGQFCPIAPGQGGGLLVRQGIDPKTGDVKYAAATGTKGYRWMESEMVKTLGKEAAIDHAYFRKLVDDAVDEINQFGDFDAFVADDSEPVVEDVQIIDPFMVR